MEEGARELLGIFCLNAARRACVIIFFFMGKITDSHPKTWHPCTFTTTLPLTLFIHREGHKNPGNILYFAQVEIGKEGMLKI